MVGGPAGTKRKMALPLKLISKPPLPQGVITQPWWLVFIQQSNRSPAPAGSQGKPQSAAAKPRSDKRRRVKRSGSSVLSSCRGLGRSSVVTNQSACSHPDWSQGIL